MLSSIFLYLALASASPPEKKSPPDPKFDRGGPDSLMIHKSTMSDDDARRYVHDFAQCVASHDRKRAAAALVFPYGSEEQSKAMSNLLDPESICFGPMITELSLRTEAIALAGGMAEYFILNSKVVDELRRREPQSFVWPAENALEAFGSCVVSQDDAATKAFLLTRVGSDEEREAANALGPALGQCIAEGQTLALNVPSLRQLLAVSFYRRVAAPPPATTAASASGN
jgi:hypothetical protein